MRCTWSPSDHEGGLLSSSRGWWPADVRVVSGGSPIEVRHNERLLIGKTPKTERGAELKVMIDGQHRSNSSGSSGSSGDNGGRKKKKSGAKRDLLKEEEQEEEEEEEDVDNVDNVVPVQQKAPVTPEDALMEGGDVVGKCMMLLEKEPESTRAILMRELIQRCKELEQDEGIGLDPEVLAASLREFRERCDELMMEVKSLKSERDHLKAQVDLLSQQDIGTVMLENESLKKKLEEAQDQLTRTNNLLSSMNVVSVVSEPAGGDVKFELEVKPMIAPKKKSWKKKKQESPPPPPPAQPASAVGRVRNETPKMSPQSQEEKKRVDNDNDMDEAGPSKRIKKEISFISDSFLDPNFNEFDAFFEGEQSSKDSVVHYRGFAKKGHAFSVGDFCYLNSGSDIPFVGVLKDVFVDEAQGEAFCKIQWLFRFDDLPESARSQRLAGVAKERRLWLSDGVDNNPLGTIIGKFSLVDMNGQSQDTLAKYVASSEHNFYTMCDVNVVELKVKNK